MTDKALAQKPLYQQRAIRAARAAAEASYQEKRLTATYSEHDSDGKRTGETAVLEVTVKTGYGDTRVLVGNTAMTADDVLALIETLKRAAWAAKAWEA